MNYTDTQIEIAKRNYNNFNQYTTVDAQQPNLIGYAESEQRCHYHNNIVDQIRNGNKQVIREWKQFFLTEAVKADQKKNESKNKKAANKAASSDLLKQIKDAGKKLGDYYKWLNTSGNPYRKEYFSKKYTQESVNEFLSI